MTKVISLPFNITVNSGTGQAFSYPGIPYVTDNVPSAIMPTLPSGADLASEWQFDPCTVSTPVWTNAANQYYVNPSHASANDANNGGRGSPSAPRATIPGAVGGNNITWTLAAGDQVFIVGDGNVYFSGSDIATWNMPGTQSNPIWIIGVGTTKPRLNYEKGSIAGISSVIFDGLHFGGTNSFRTTLTGVQTCCFRNNLFTGAGTQSFSSRRFLSLVGTSTTINRFVVIYNNEMRDLGAWNPGVSAIDCMGVHVQQWTRYTWIINNRIYHIQGDSVMCGNSNYWDFDYARRSHYTYVAGNEMYENYENAYDNKDCYHTIFSSNYAHDFSTTGSEPPANATCVIMGQDSEGYASGYTWIVNNHLEDVGTGVRCSATSSTYRGYCIGNLIVNATSNGLNFEPRNHTHSADNITTNAEYVSAINNTFIGCNRFLSTPRGASLSEVVVVGNIAIDCTDTLDARFRDYGNARTYTDNIVFRSAGGENVRLDGTLTTSNNTEGTNPNLNSTHVPNAGSIAINYQSTRHPDYALFQTLYGIPLTIDRRGLPVPITNLEAGCHQV